VVRARSWTLHHGPLLSLADLQPLRRGLLLQTPATLQPQHQCPQQRQPPVTVHSLRLRRRPAASHVIP
jgi:hypothetical protein